MIQRIQSIWLLLASACAFLSLKLPFYSGTNKVGVASYKLTGTENYYLMLLTIAIGILALIIIFLYKDRRLQVRLCVVGMMLQIGLILLYYREVTSFVTGSGTYALTALLQGLVIFFFFFAIRGISKDIKVVKSSDRLR